MESQTSTPLATLRRFMRPRSAAERCELCSAELATDHAHLVECASRRLLCACDACALLFAGQNNTRYRRVPRRIEFLVDFHMSDAQWDSLHIPINLAFFSSSISAGRAMALYPSPAGATESLLTLEAWQDLVAGNPALAELEPEVEALLVNRIGQCKEYYRVPIDECYKLVGIIRTHWRGLSGGPDVWGHIHQFFTDLKSRSSERTGDRGGGRVHMPDLNFQVELAEPQPYAAAPLLIFKLRVSNVDRQPSETIQSVVLRCQIRIEPVQRRYQEQEQARLLELFGERHRWSQTLRSMLWTHTGVVVPSFTESILVDLPVPCTYDFNVAATKYFDALVDGEIPLCLLFSGTIFLTSGNGPLQVAQIPWEKETTFHLPVQVWRKMMEMYYPNSAWLCLRKDVFDRLRQYKTQCGSTTWEGALENLLSCADTSEKVTP